jgi:hypothetical protein
VTIVSTLVRKAEADMKRRAFLAAILALPAAPALAFEGSRGGGRLNAIASGRLYDPILTPKLNPSFALDSRAEQQLLRDMRNGRVDRRDIPEQQLRYFEFRLQQQR